jgi:hypothetical protein
MLPPEGRSPYPRDGDPNVKMVRLELTTNEWRELRGWAAEDATTVDQLLARIVRGELEGRPRRAF